MRVPETPCPLLPPTALSYVVLMLRGFFGGFSDLGVGAQLAKVEARGQGGGRTLVGLTHRASKTFEEGGALAKTGHRRKFS